MWLFIMDVDGTLTNGSIYIGERGEMMKAFNVKDGYGITNLLKEIEATPIIITGRKSDIVTCRCNELEISNVYQGIKDKKEKVKEVISQFNVGTKVAYIGDDQNDLSCMLYIKEINGIIGCPSDADESVIKISDFISSRTGGNGAVREFIEYLIKNNIKES